MNRVSRALISVHDKTGIVEFARGLAAIGVEILSTGGTAALLRESGVTVVDVSEVTGFPEMLRRPGEDAAPKVHGGILARRPLPEHMAALERHGIRPIDLVVVTLYPFEQTVARAGRARSRTRSRTSTSAGPSMIRGAAKNHESVGVITDPGQYAPVLGRAAARAARCRPDTRYRLAYEAFRRTAQYDAAIATYLREPGRAWRRTSRRRGDALCRRGSPSTPSASRASATARTRIRRRRSTGRRGAPIGLAAAAQLHGPELSLQQSARLVGRAGPPPRVRGSGGGGDQAHQSVRGRGRRGGGRGDAARQGVRSRVDLRGHRGSEPAARPGGREGAVRHSPRDPLRARVRARRAGGAAAAPRRSAACSSSRARVPTIRRGCAEHAQRARRSPRPGRRSHRSRSRRARRGVAPRAHRRRDGRAPLRLAGRQARQVQRHRARHGRAGGRRGRGTDEPGRLRPHRRHARAGGGARDPGHGVRLGRLLSRSATDSTWWRGRAPPPRSIRAARSATRRSSPPPTSTAWRWSPAASATSSTDRGRPPTPSGSSACGS